MTFEEHWDNVDLRKRNEELESENFDLKEEIYELTRQLEEYDEPYIYSEDEDYE